MASKTWWNPGWLFSENSRCPHTRATSFRSNQKRPERKETLEFLYTTRGTYFTCSRGKLKSSVWRSSSLIIQSSTTLEEIENVGDFVRRLEKIELPNQLVAVIGDPLLQKFLQLKSSELTFSRIDNWLLAFFEDQLQSLGPSETLILPMLVAIRDYTHYIKVLAPWTMFSIILMCASNFRQLV